MSEPTDDTQVNRVLARLSTRGTGRDGKGTVDLILGAGMKGNNLKPNTIYELRETMGVLSVAEIGPSAAVEKEQPLSVWTSGLSYLVEVYRERWLLTHEEWLARNAQLAQQRAAKEGEVATEEMENEEPTQGVSR